MSDKTEDGELRAELCFKLYQQSYETLGINRQCDIDTIMSCFTTKAEQLAAERVKQNKSLCSCLMCEHHTSAHRLNGGQSNG